VAVLGNLGRHACCSVVSVVRFEPWQKTVRVVASMIYSVNPISANGHFLFSSRGTSVKVQRRSW
jgi:hypothetical protein